MAWIPSHQDIRDHPKTRRAARKAGTTVPAMVGHLHLLWHWAIDRAGDGDLAGFDNDDLADAAMWEGDADQFVGALADCGTGGGAGFIDADRRLHDWAEYGGKYAERVASAKKAASARWHPEEDASALPTHDDRTAGARADALPEQCATDAPCNAEPVREPCAPGADRNADLDLEKENHLGGAKAPPFESDFAEAWAFYPRRSDRGAAFKAYQARRRAGATVDDLLAATRHYAAERAGQETRFTKKGATFFGPTDVWREYLTGPDPDASSGTNGGPPGAGPLPSTPQLDAEEAEMRRIAGYDQ